MDFPIARWIAACLCGVLLSCQSTRESGSGENPARVVAATAERIAALHPPVGGKAGAGIREEAGRLAIAAESEARRLADRYRVATPAWVHNCLVNTGIRERGLCWQYMEDLFARLYREASRHFELHCGVRDNGSVFLEHHCVVLTAAGRPFETGLVLDPWRRPGRLGVFPARGEGKPWFNQPGYTRALQQKLEPAAAE